METGEMPEGGGGMKSTTGDKVAATGDKVAGYLYQGSWHLGDTISVRYAIRYRDRGPVGGSLPDLEDVFIYWTDCQNLLNLCKDDSAHIAHLANLSTWTVCLLEGDQVEELSPATTTARVVVRLCSLSDFVYRAVLVSGGGGGGGGGGKNRQRGGPLLFDGILRFIVRHLTPPPPPPPPPSPCEGRAGGSRSHLVPFTTSSHTETVDGKPITESGMMLSLTASNNSGVTEASGKPARRRGRPRKETKASLDNNSVNGVNDMTSAELCVKDEPEHTSDNLDYHDDPMESAATEEKAVLVPVHPSRRLKKRFGSVPTCQECGQTFRTEAHWVSHYRNQHPESPHCHDRKEKVSESRKSADSSKKRVNDATAPDACPACGKSFATVKHLYNHCRREHPDKPDICPEEPIRLGPIRTLHERRADRGETGNSFVCGLAGCGLLFDRFLSLVDHERTGHPDAFLCILCGTACYSADNLIAHSDTRHADKAAHVCRVCGFFNRNSRGLVMHTQQEHMKGSVRYQCEQCPYSSENYVTFGNHKRTAHREENSMFVCEECGNNFATKQSLTSHRRLHNPEFKRFQCQYCPQRFGHSSVLLIHMRVHTGEKPFVCKICGATFGSQTACTRHRRIVHASENEMAFTCKDCGKKYPSRAKNDYENHCKIHSGVRDHVCSLCGSAYFSSKGLRKHERAAHPSQKPMRPKPFKIGSRGAAADSSVAAHLQQEEVLPSSHRDQQQQAGHHLSAQHQHHQQQQQSGNGVGSSYPADEELLTVAASGDMNLQQLAYRHCQEGEGVGGGWGGGES